MCEDLIAKSQYTYVFTQQDFQDYLFAPKPRKMGKSKDKNRLGGRDRFKSSYDGLLAKKTSAGVSYAECYAELLPERCGFWQSEVYAFGGGCSCVAGACEAKLYCCCLIGQLLLHATGGPCAVACLLKTHACIFACN
jgi:hypothetical protein